MHIPIIVDPKDIHGMTVEQLAGDTECICGNLVPLRSCIAIWTHKVGSPKPLWFPACNEVCVVAHISEGNA